MKLLRTIPWFTRLLVGLFLVVQFAGMVSSPRADAMPMAASHVSAVDAPADAHASHGDHNPMQPHFGRDMPCGHHDHGGGFSDACCALHACFAGLVPLSVAVAADAIAGEPPSAHPDDRIPRTPGSRLDRPPRPLH